MESKPKRGAPRRKNKNIGLTQLGVKSLATPGKHADGKGLYLHVSTSGSKSWLFRYLRNGKQREMGLGSLDRVTLAAARSKADEARQQLGLGLDPLGERQKSINAEVLEAAKRITFEDAAHRYIESHRSGWKSAKHASQWGNTLRDYVYPVFGRLPVQDVDTALVMRALSQPVGVDGATFWTAKTETAKRIQGRIEAVLNWSTTSGYRTGDNPARWRGHLDNLLPKPSAVRAVVHHAALPFTEIGSFIADLRPMQSTSARALEFLILTATRTSEVIGAKWDEFDKDFQVWTIPASRMKAKREHRVPLPTRAREIVLMMRKTASGDYVFEGDKPKRPLSSMALLMLLRRMKRDDLTAHGFRSTFRDWASERTNYPREVCEQALAHTIPDAVEAAYRRGDLFAKRRKLMLAWDSECNTIYLNGGKTAVTIISINHKEVAAGGSQ